MSDVVLNAEPAGVPRPALRRRARIAVAAARVLAFLPPARLAGALRFLARGATPARRDTALAARDAVLSVSVRCSGRFCLDRSIATALTCRAQGEWPEWHAGVAVEPFRAHAWVSVDGMPVGEAQWIPSAFVPTLSVHAGGQP